MMQNDTNTGDNAVEIKTTISKLSDTVMCTYEDITITAGPWNQEKYERRYTITTPERHYTSAIRRLQLRRRGSPAQARLRRLQRDHLHLRVGDVPTPLG